MFAKPHEAKKIDCLTRRSCVVFVVLNGVFSFCVRLDKDTLPMQPIEIVPPRSGGTIPMGAPLRRAKKKGGEGAP